MISETKIGEKKMKMVENFCVLTLLQKGDRFCDCCSQRYLGLESGIFSIVKISCVVSTRDDIYRKETRALRRPHQEQINKRRPAELGRKSVFP